MCDIVPQPTQHKNCWPAGKASCVQHNPTISDPHKVLSMQLCCLGIVSPILRVSGMAKVLALCCTTWRPSFVCRRSLGNTEGSSMLQAIGASERVMYYLDKPVAAQIQGGDCVPSWSGKVSNISSALLGTNCWLWLCCQASS